MTPAFAPAPLLGHHFVHFYREDRLLLDEAADFIDGAVRGGQVGLVMAAPTHRAALQERLQGSRFAVGAPHWYPGELVLLDAAQTLDGFLCEGWPDAQRFDDS